MQDGLFFRVLRRFNMILVTVIGLAVIVVGGHSLLKEEWVQNTLAMARFEAGPAPVQLVATGDVIQAETYANPNTQFTFGGDYLYVLKRTSVTPPAGPAGPAENYTSIGPQQDINLLAVDVKSGQARWLFKDNKRNILSRDGVYQGEPIARNLGSPDPRPLIGVVLWVVETDTDKSGTLGDGDAITLYFWRKGSADPVKLLVSEMLIGTTQVGADHYLITYKKGKETRAALYSVPEFKLLSDNPLPDAPH